MILFCALSASRPFDRQSIIAGIGVGVAFSALEAWRFPVLGPSSSELAFSPLRSSHVALLTLAFCCLYYLIRRRRLAKPSTVAVASALSCVTLGCYVASLDSAGQTGIFGAIGFLHMGFAVLLFMMWMEELLRMPDAKAVDVMAIGLISAFVIQVSVVALDTAAAWALVVVLPLLSGTSYVFHRKVAATAIQALDSSIRREGRHEDGPLQVSRLREVAPLLLLALIWGLVFGLLNSVWKSSEYIDQAASIQALTASGSLLAAGVLIILRRPIPGGTIEVTVVVFALAALLIGNILSGTRLFLLPLNVAQKLMFALLLIGSQRFDDKPLRALSYCSLFFAYRLGLSIQGDLRSVLAQTGSIDAAESSEIIASIGCVAMVCLAVYEMARFQPPAPTETREPIDYYRKLAFNYYLSQRFELTQRETGIVELLVSGKSIPEIASELSISQSTVKTHLHNVYGKANVRSQGELLDLIDSEHHAFFNGG